METGCDTDFTFTKNINNVGNNILISFHFNSLQFTLKFYKKKIKIKQKHKKIYKWK